MYHKTLRRWLIALALSVLLLTPTVPVWADGPNPAGLFGWLDGWLTSVSSWLSGGEAQSVDSLDESESTAPGDPQPLGEPSEPTTVEDGDNEAGPSIDPVG